MRILVVAYIKITLTEQAVTVHKRQGIIMYRTSISKPLKIFYFICANQQSNLFEGHIALLESCGYHTEKLTLNSDLNKINPGDICLIHFTSFSADENVVDAFGIDIRWILIDALKTEIDEQKFITLGFDGIFYQHDSPDIFLKGMNVLCEGDFWFSRQAINNTLRKLLFRHVKNQRTQANNRATKRAELTSLTKREKLIIEFVSVGAKNHEIADKLHISVNTVKTHIYSIFKKTNSRNRIELMSWSNEIS